MISFKTLKSLEFDRILSFVSDRAVLSKTKDEIKNFQPVSNKKQVEFLLSKTNEAYQYLYKYSLNDIYFFNDVSDELKRANTGGTLNIPEILRVTDNLKAARIIRTAIEKIVDSSLIIIPEIASRLFTNLDFENEISKIILSEDSIADNASEKLYQIRKNIRDINVKIRDQLNSYMRGSLGKYMQENVVTMRENRYVIPVKSEYKGFVKGFIHDQSSTGSTVFIEPAEILDLNNKLKEALLDEQNEIHRILHELSNKISYMSDGIRYNAENIVEIDNAFARAKFSFDYKCSIPVINDKGIFNIKRARHPLIDRNKVIPISYHFGDPYNFLLITGPNTGGKTVTLKLTGLISLMSMSGLFVPCDDESEVSIFNNVFCDIGDEQSIEESLSTFSSHIKNIIDIIDNVDYKSLVLIDEIGAGTDPDEGSALALSIIEKLLEKNCFGIITTHYSKLKEFAVESNKIENACMEFDPITLKPMYKMSIGIPGSSNAIEIAKSLGLDESIINKSYGYLNKNQVSFEKVIKKAEESRRENEKLNDELERLKSDKQKELEDIAKLKEKVKIEHEKIYSSAKAETKKIVADRLTEAEEIIDELKLILKNANLESKDVFKANELKNRLKNSRYLIVEDEIAPLDLVKLQDKDYKIGKRIYLKNINSYATIASFKSNKKEVEVYIGDIKSTVKKDDIYFALDDEQKQDIKVFRNVSKNDNIQREINVIGKTSIDTMQDVELFLDQAVLHNLEEIKIIHGVGNGVLLKVIREYLKNNKNVKEFRRGNYGEGENGVTIIKLK